MTVCVLPTTKMTAFRNIKCVFNCYSVFSFSHQMSTTTFPSSCHPPTRPPFLKEHRSARLSLRCRPQTWTLVCTGWWEAVALITSQLIFTSSSSSFPSTSPSSSDPVYDPEGWERGLSVLQHRLAHWRYCHSCLFWPWAESFLLDWGAVTGQLRVSPTRPARPTKHRYHTQKIMFCSFSSGLVAQKRACLAMGFPAGVLSLLTFLWQHYFNSSWLISPL